MSDIAVIDGESGGESAKKRKHEVDEENAQSESKRLKRAKKSHSNSRKKTEKATGTEGIVTGKKGHSLLKTKQRKKERRQRRRDNKKDREDGIPDQLDSTAPQPAVLARRKREQKRSEDAAKASKRAAKKEKRQKRVAIETKAANGDIVEIARKSKQKRTPPASDSSTPWWTLSPPSAGRYLDQDPIFVQDEYGSDYLISANRREVQLLSLETSLVVRTFPVPDGRLIKCFSSSRKDQYTVSVALDNGALYTLDWRTDDEMKNKHSLLDTTAAMTTAGVSQTIRGPSSFFISQDSQKYKLYSQGADVPSFETQYTLDSIQVLGNLDHIVALGPSTLVLGAKKDGDESSTNIVWTQIPLNSAATCFHARLLPADPPTKKNKSPRPGLALAIGNSSGQIHLYDDISTILGRTGKPQLPPPRILHWHREAVSSVKFSQDGNYLISGGKETVLVLWQLSTAKKQYLPHLTSTIERIVVNPKGDRYAVQMGDNSIMVLSTSELKPVANFAGLQLAGRTEELDGTASTSRGATLHPRQSNQLLLSVPSTRPTLAEGNTTRPFLQTFDLSTSRHIARQALARNNVTDFNLGPEGTPITPPDVQQMAMSRDGLWLATVDEWMPPASDLEHLLSDDTDMQSLRPSRREVYLKFWTWDERESMWTLTTRADSPHPAAERSMGSGQVLSLIADPASNTFATIGEGACVKIWKPRKRTRHGVVLKDRSDVDLTEWSCKRTIQLPRAQERVDSPFASTEAHKSVTASLSYAGDGSMLAATLSTDATEEAPVVHFINAATGEAIPKSNLAAHNIVDMGFLNQYFIAVSRPAAYVWDLINDTLVYKIKIASHKTFDRHEQPFLTIDAVGGTFALTVRDKKVGMTKVLVYGPQHNECLHKQMFDTTIEAVLAGSGTKGYTLLFSDATVRALSPAASVPSRLLLADAKLMASEPEQQLATSGAKDQPADAMDIDAPAAEDMSVRAVDDDDEDDRPVVRPEQLASIFDTPQSFAMPPVRDMFASVVGLFGKQPYVKPLVEIS